MPAFLQGLSPPTTPDLSASEISSQQHESRATTRDDTAQVIPIASEAMSHQASASSSGSGPSSPAKSTGLNMYHQPSSHSSGAPQYNNNSNSSRYSLRPKPSPAPSSASASANHYSTSRYSFYNNPRLPSPAAAAVGGGGPSSSVSAQGLAGPYSANSSMNSNNTSHLPSKHLITVIPPDCLPHDPPHPRANPQASGYGPPANFKRGVLLPLYPTLSAQLGAIAREYGLPSKGGLIVYLLELSTELVSDGPHQAFVGGPRITDEAWQLLWSRLFELDLLRQREQEEEAMDLSELDEDEEMQQQLQQQQQQLRRHNDSSRPPVPPVPQQHRFAASQHAAGGNLSTDDQRYSDQSSRDNSDAPSPDFYANSMDATSSSLTSPPPPSANNSLLYQQQQQQQQLRQSNGLRSPPPNGQFRPSSRASRRPPTSQSMRSMRRQTAMSFASSMASSSYGPSVIVGKLEFDVDRRRGAGKWYDAWMDQASVGGTTPQIQSQSTFNSAPVPPPHANFDSPAYSTFASPVHSESRATLQRGLVPDAQQQQQQQSSSAPQSRGAGGKAELYLPGLVNRKSHILQSMSPSSSSSSMAAFPKSSSVPATPQQPTLQSLAREEQEQEQDQQQPLDESSLNLSLDSSKTSETQRPASSTSSNSGASEDGQGTKAPGHQQEEYAQLADEDDGSGYEHSASASVDLDSRPLSGIRISRSNTTTTSTSDRRDSTASSSRRSRQRDPLADVFGQDETTWKTFGSGEDAVGHSGEQQSGLGLGLGMGMPDALGPRLTSEAEEGKDSPIDDVREVKDFLSQQRASQRSSKRRSAANLLSSPIHLEQEQFEGPQPNLPSTFEASLPATSAAAEVSSSSDLAAPVTSTPPPLSATSAPTITRESPSAHEARMSVPQAQASTTMPPVPEGGAIEEKETYRPASPSQWSSFAALHNVDGQTTPSSSSPGPAKDPDASRESVEMDFDNIEKALAELSPKAMRRPGAAPTKVTSRRPSAISPAASPGFQTQSFSTAQKQELKKASYRTSSFSARSHSTESPNTTHSPVAPPQADDTPRLAEQHEAPQMDQASANVTSEQQPAVVEDERMSVQHPDVVEDETPQQVQHIDDKSEAVDHTATPREEIEESTRSAEHEAPPLPEKSEAGPQQPEVAEQELASEATMLEPSAQARPQQQQPEEPASFEAPRSPPSLPYMHSPTLPPSASEPEPSTPRSPHSQGAPTTFEGLLSPQHYVPPSEANPPARGSSLQNSLRKPWAARTSPRQQSPTQFQGGEANAAAHNSGGFMSKLLHPSRKNSSSSKSEDPQSAGLSAAVTSKLHSPKERATPVFANPPYHTSTLAQRRRGVASPPASPGLPSSSAAAAEGEVRHIDFAAQARAYFDSESSDPLAGMRDSPKSTAAPTTSEYGGVSGGGESLR